MLTAVLLVFSTIVQPEHAAKPLQRRSRFAQGLNARRIVLEIKDLSARR
jgi:tRNA threonylcarbamoyladenosine modification (KEOPS) complex  Pcc1 subunit